jgi:diaminopimelate epimerase
MSRLPSGAVPFVKGHGTGNDFVLLPDHDGSRYGERVEAEFVRALCDRRRGIGADGVIRVVRSGSPGLPDAPGAQWFMDYVNADGSLAEMCGNGVRVLVRHLLTEGLVPDDGTPVAIGTRGGVMHVDVHDDGDLTVDMGRVRSPMSGSPVHVDAVDVRGPGTAVAMPNPHAVVQVGDLDTVGRLHEAPVLHPWALFPDGANVEFVVPVGPAHVAMRVWERGVGETLSCGTGVCAVAWVAMERDEAPAGTTYTVDVPGGRLWVTQDEAGSLHLRGPAVLVASGIVDVDALVQQAAPILR